LLFVSNHSGEIHGAFMGNSQMCIVFIHAL
jgi:hypothetical protein